ncbi:hypothetical protein BDV59DRAFT_196726 [Aspergillus ambiguus]|uniref:uncharacterized protein n=1 Tax=Aspergillus ambiguus TaxID=176160 RepID=UPI003CCD4CC8
MDALTESMRNSRLSDRPAEPEHLLFSPQSDSALAENALDDIPRYLFRVVTPHSDGEANETWMRSEAAYRHTDSSLEDIFSLLDAEKRTTIARSLNLHFRWWPKGKIEDNFVSWTSSHLFAIRYVYYRHLSNKDGSSLDNIHLYVVDTTRFAKGTFICDSYLIDAFYKFDDHEPQKNLENLRDLRERYNFGEYLSQGSLKIEDKHQMISARSLFDNGRLLRLQPHFIEPDSTAPKIKNPGLVFEVARLRGKIWPVTNIQKLPSAEMLDRLQVVGEIIENLAPGWRFPLAIYFASLISSESATEDQVTANDNVFLAYFRSKAFDEERKGFNPLDFKVIVREGMPELNRVKTIAREIYKDFQLRKALDLIRVAERKILLLQSNDISQEHGSALSVADSNEVLVRAGETVLSKLRMIEKMCEEVALAISPSRV